VWEPGPAAVSCLRGDGRMRPTWGPGLANGVQGPGSVVVGRSAAFATNGEDAASLGTKFGRRREVQGQRRTGAGQAARWSKVRRRSMHSGGVNGGSR
jgi:hypothetical protein